MSDEETQTDCGIEPEEAIVSQQRGGRYDLEEDNEQVVLQMHHSPAINISSPSTIIDKSMPIRTPSRGKRKYRDGVDNEFANYLKLASAKRQASRRKKSSCSSSSFVNFTLSSCVTMLCKSTAAITTLSTFSR